MTAIDPAPRALPEIGQTRYAADVRMGWHVQIDDDWRLVKAVRPMGAADDEVLLVLRDGREERRERMSPRKRLMTRNPEEQIQYVEAGRLAAPPPPPGRDYGPVSRIHHDQQILAALGESATGVCPTCGGAVFGNGGL